MRLGAMVIGDAAAWTGPEASTLRRSAGGDAMPQMEPVVNKPKITHRSSANSTVGGIVDQRAARLLRRTTMAPST
jgi:hypothetical protein